MPLIRRDARRPLRTCALVERANRRVRVVPADAQDCGGTGICLRTEPKTRTVSATH